MPARKTHCVHGHALSPDNVYSHPSGRKCRACTIRRALDRYYASHPNAKPRKGNRVPAVLAPASQTTSTLRDIIKDIGQAPACALDVVEAYLMESQSRDQRIQGQLDSLEPFALRMQFIEAIAHCLADSDFPGALDVSQAYEAFERALSVKVQ